MTKDVIFSKYANKPLEVEICAIASWEGFDQLIAFLQQEYSAIIIEENDGPDARRWILESNHQRFELVHDDMFGNYLIAPTKDSEPLVYEIALDIEKRILEARESS